MEAWMLAGLVGSGLGSMTMPSDDAMTEPYPVRRMEVFTGAGHRRTWSPELKAQIVAESYSGLESACAVARRYGLAQTQLFTWRREAQTRALSPAELQFAPVVVEPPPALPAPPRPKRPGRKRRRGGDGGIELEIDGVVMRVARGADAKTVAAVIRALKAEP
jgi:transposase